MSPGQAASVSSTRDSVKADFDWTVPVVRALQKTTAFPDSEPIFSFRCRNQTAASSL